ncbi:MAG: hypothetical protein FJ298_03670 [Planctomycetes bacterium]|nr:hypothetical protein [Planctomycetota bacterium]
MEGLGCPPACRAPPRAAERTDTVARGMGYISSATQSTVDAVTDLHRASAGLQTQSARLREEATRFLANLRAP